MPVIVPWPDDGPAFGCRTGTLMFTSAGEIERWLGFGPRRDSVPGKSDHEWLFTVDGEPCAIWDSHNSARYGMFSTFGPREIFAAQFGERARL